MERSGMELVRDIIETPIGTNGGQYIKIVYEIYIISTGREGKIMRLSINEILAKANMIENAEARIQFIKSNDILLNKEARKQHDSKFKLI